VVRRDATVRSILAKGDLPQGEAAAEMLIIRQSGNWGVKNIEGLRLHASLIARNPKIFNSKKYSDRIGFVLQRAVKSKKMMSRTSMDAKLINLQRQKLPSAHKVFRSLLNVAKSKGMSVSLDVESLMWTYVKWGSEQPRFPARRQILRDYSNKTEQIKNTQSGTSKSEEME
jgi:hypothetical protein